MKSLLSLFMVLIMYCPLSADIIGDITVKIIRVSFQNDDLDGTTGNGDFLYLTGLDMCNEYTIDPLPHDKFYFESQLMAVDNYFRAVSYGKFGIDLGNSRVYPDEDQSSYILSNTMDNYHPYAEDDLHEQRLTELFKEAVELAYFTDGIEITSAEIVIIIHAGIGQDFSLPFLDPTPEDIPSTYVDAEMLQTYNNGPITIGNSTVEHGIILPETQNHLFYDIAESMFSTSSTPCEYQFGLTGTFALMMGFAVGLPPLWDTESGESGIGIFGLMDQGSNNGRGLIPSTPDAWTRVYAGWEEPKVVKPGTNVQLASRSEDNLIKVDINSDEYFLIENRTNWFRDSVSIDSSRYLMYEQSGNEQRYPPFVEVLFDTVEIEKDENGVVTSIPDYDLGLPASGLLIWHIDENRINSGLISYSVNGDRENRGVDLEEADGAQDIGYPNIFLFTDPTGGYFGDMWFQGNPEYEALYENDNEPLEFGPFTYPNTKSNDGATTYLSISNMGLPNDTMSFSVTNAMLAYGFPDTSLHIGLIYDLDGDGVMDIIGGKDSLWVAEEGDFSNKLYFYSTTNEIYDFSVGHFDGTDRLIACEKDSSNTYVSYFEINIGQNNVELVSLDTLNFINALFVNDSLGNHQYKQSSDDFFLKAYVQNSDGSIDSVQVPASMGDLDLDGSAEYVYELRLIADVPSSVIYLDAKHLNGVTVSGFPLDTMTNHEAPLIKDLIGDEHPEIVVQNIYDEVIIINWQGELEYRLSNYGKIVCLSEYEGRNAIVTESAIWLFDEVSENVGNEWTSTHHDFGNTRTLHLNIPKRTPESALIDKDKTYAYPNPVYDQSVKIRIAVESAEKVEIMIYDFAGYFIKKLTLDTVTPGSIHELLWNTKNVESGVYFANVTAENGSRSETEILKIGVIK